VDTAIPFNRPFVVGKELYYIAQAVQKGHLAGDGQFTKMCNAWMEKRFQAQKVLLTHSCTAALEMAALLAEVGPGDEVIMPSLHSCRPPTPSLFAEPPFDLWISVRIR